MKSNKLMPIYIRHIPIELPRNIVCLKKCASISAEVKEVETKKNPFSSRWIENQRDYGNVMG